MDGLAGVAYPNILQMNGFLHPMLDSMKHRGGTSHDIFTHKNIEIGICGKKIISDSKNMVHIAIDGEIFNSQELKTELKHEHHNLDEVSLPQLLLHGYEVWGNNLFAHLNGYFSIAILDQKKKRLVLARDTIGKKPLYWYHNNNSFLFASELKALMTTGIIPQTPAMDSLSAYLFFGFIPQDMSPIKDVNKLLPAHYLQYNFDGSKSIHSYWSISSYFDTNSQIKPGQIVDHLGELLTESTKSRLPEEEHVGAFVSGGLGSASIAYYLSTLKEKKDLSAFTVAFEGETEEDISIAKEVTSGLGISHKYHSISEKNFLDDFVKIVWHLDEPLADANVIATWKLAELAANKTHTIFSGMGSDELLAGHSRYSVEEQTTGKLARCSQCAMSTMRQILIPILNKIYKPAALELIKQSRTDPWQYQYMLNNALCHKDGMAKASPKLASYFDPEVFLHKFHHVDRTHSNVGAFLYFDLKTRLPDNFMLQYERITSAHSLDWRTPYLDRNVVEFLVSLPEPDSLDEKETASFLKEMMEGVLPDSLIKRPKRTRKNFLKDWIANPEYAEIFQSLETGVLVDAGLISKSWLKSHLKTLGSSDQTTQCLWSILALEVWFRLYITRPISSSPPEISLKELLLE